MDASQSTVSTALAEQIVPDAVSQVTRTANGRRARVRKPRNAANRQPQNSTAGASKASRRTDHHRWVQQPTNNGGSLLDESKRFDGIPPKNHPSQADQVDLSQRTFTAQQSVETRSASEFASIDSVESHMGAGASSAAVQRCRTRGPASRSSASQDDRSAALTSTPQVASAVDIQPSMDYVRGRVTVVQGDDAAVLKLQQKHEKAEHRRVQKSAKRAGAEQARRAVLQELFGSSRWTSAEAVSYTHLTLPTNREV